MGSNSIRIGKLFGIEIAVDFSWFIIFSLVTWSVAGHYFSAYGEWPLIVRMTTALATALLFFTSIILHELGHSLVAVKTGIPVKRITLFIFGGMAQIEREPRKASHELIIALAGPFTSLALAGLFFLLGAAGGSGGVVALEAAGFWLARTNLILAVFNLLPGFPLDGGRVFRAVVWAVTKNQPRATHATAVIGRLIAGAFILLGIWQVFSGNWADGIWLAFIGWFLDAAARHSAQQEAFAHLLAGRTVREALQDDCAPIGPNLPLDRLVSEIIIPSGRRCLPVMDGERLLGAATVERVKEIPREEWPTTPVAEVMIPAAELASLGPADELSTALALLDEKHQPQAAVFDERGAFLGLLTREGIINHIKMISELGE